jgi:hypothetical protein
VRACVQFFFFAILFQVFVVYKCLHAVPGTSLQDFAHLRFANVYLSLADASSTGPARAIFRPLSFYGFF